MGLVFMLGAALQEVPILDAMYAGRFLAGLAIGSTSMVSIFSQTNPWKGLSD
jgi:hypothetical protein